MTKPPPPTFLPHVAQDILDILAWSTKHFGREAASRYEALIRQALRDIQADPERPGAKSRPDLAPNAYVYHLSFSRDRSPGGKVQTPRHFVVYRYSGIAVELPEFSTTAATWPATYPRNNPWDVVTGAGAPGQRQLHVSDLGLLSTPQTFNSSNKAPRALLR